MLGEPSHFSLVRVGRFAMLIANLSPSSSYGLILCTLDHALSLVFVLLVCSSVLYLDLMYITCFMYPK